MLIASALCVSSILIAIT